jgi:hypothetical protein
VFDKLHLNVGDFLEAVALEGKIIMIPQQLTAKAPAPALTKEEQKILRQVKDKVLKIQTDLINSYGLSDEEIELAARVGLIDKEQAWWWREEWQKGERKVEENIAQGEVSGAFEDMDKLIEHLQG